MREGFRGDAEEDVVIDSAGLALPSSCANGAGRAIPDYSGSLGRRGEFWAKSLWGRASEGSGTGGFSGAIHFARNRLQQGGWLLDSCPLFRATSFRWFVCVVPGRGMSAV
jgi:hypothetical protein